MKIKSSLSKTMRGATRTRPDSFWKRNCPSSLYLTTCWMGIQGSEDPQSHGAEGGGRTIMQRKFTLCITSPSRRMSPAVENSSQKSSGAT